LGEYSHVHCQVRFCKAPIPARRDEEKPFQNLDACGIRLRDIANGYFRWEWVRATFALFVPVGFLMSRLIPMQADLNAKAVTLSLDKIYLILIWVLVIAKLVMGHIPSLVFIADIIMCSILGIMSGRLGGIGIRVRRLKVKYGFVGK